ncbi:MAG: HEAT repeat domain-containing protein, partial [Nitrospirota bacterium]
MQDVLKLILIAIILSVVFLILIILFAAALRRVFHSWKYKKLDEQREFYREKLKSLLHYLRFQKITDLLSSPKSIKFRAVEDVLLDSINVERYKENAKELFNRLGYIAFYEKQLKSRNIITRASAIDKLGKMLSKSSTDKLIDMLKTKDAETISVAVRSLSKIGSLKGLKGILEHLPDLFKKSLVARKTIETSLINFGIDAVPILIEYGKKHDDPKITASILEVLSALQAKEGLYFAIDDLTHRDAEIRAKALNAIGTIGSVDFDGGRVVPLLDDSVWFVRLQAAKALGNLRYKKAATMLGGLLLDENWQVRNAAAMALTKFGDVSIDIFRRVLRYKDLYAKETVCEEIEKTNFV